MARRHGAHELNATLPLSWLVAIAAVLAMVVTDFAALGRRDIGFISRFPIAFATNVALALAARALGTVTTSGATNGAIIGSTIFITTGWPGWGLLGWGFALTVVTTKWRRQRKARQNIAEPRGGRRAAGNVWANTGLASILSVVAASRPDEPIWIAATAAALAAGVTDSVASEIGKAVGGPTWLLPSFTRVQPGTTGAISTSGTVAALVAGLSFGAIATVSGLVGASVTGLIVAVAAIAACILEGWVAGVTEERGVLDNDGVNFVATAIAAIIAPALLLIVP